MQEGEAVQTIEVGVSLGANTGDRLAALKHARDLLAAAALPQSVFSQSPLYETDPVDAPAGSPVFLNAVIVFETSQSPHELLANCQSIEAQLGRAPLAARSLNAPRPLDLDLLYYGDSTLNTQELILPHPRLTQRRFVLEPLYELRPELVLPTHSDPVRTLLATLQSAEPPLKLFQKEW